MTPLELGVEGNCLVSGRPPAPRPTLPGNRPTTPELVTRAPSLPLKWVVQPVPGLLARHA